MSEKNDNILGQNIRSHRKRNNLTQKELGEKLNVSASAVRMWEKNGNRPPLETLKHAADIFNISFAELVGYDEGITVESLTQKERTIIGYYRSKEHIRNAIDSLIESADNSIALYTAANSEKAVADAIIYVRKEEWERIKNAPETDDPLM